MSKLALNVGSGQRKFDSVQWINVDSVSRLGHEPDLVADGAHLPQEDATVDYFILHHVMEHFGCGDAKGLIQEAYRVLKPGGSLLIFIPDLKTLAGRWLGGEISDYIFIVNLMGAYMGNEADRHKWHYTVASLTEALKEASPWSEIKPFDWRQVPGMDAARDFWILAYEAVK
jgi:predicted SAM-dependent methyltransferase